MASRTAKLMKSMTSGSPTAPADTDAAPALAAVQAPQSDGASDEGTAEATLGQAGPASERFDGGRLGLMLSSAADQQVAPAQGVTATTVEQSATPQAEQPGLAAAAQFLPFMQLQPASVPLQQAPVSQPAPGDDAAEQQRILQQSAQLQQQQVRSEISSRTSLYVAGARVACAAAQSACRWPRLLENSVMSGLSLSGVLFALPAEQICGTRC